MYCDWPVLKRCCFCMPLRRGVLVVAYLNVVFCGFMVGIYSYAVDVIARADLVYKGMTITLPAELCIFIYIMEMGFNALLIYGAHMRIKKYVKIYYYYAISTTVASFLMFILELTTVYHSFILIEIFLFGFIGLCIQVYLLILVWSLLNKLQDDGPHVYENQLHQIINGQAKVETNGVYNPSTIPNNAVIV
ncbi:hypothetical protein ABMA28_003910 [Loxostege sticticalis]|uniref:Uncharacterized protein n=1 Tax=Loxostege sticticalis TaxID=481309 RepID=A0ABD0STG9_LOXSC